MSNSIIQVTNLSKSYTISHEGKERYIALRDVMANKAKKIFSFPKSLTSTSFSTKEEFWALKDINFEIEQGDRVGIIGRNGAGKSTLLKILSRITEPTSGEIKIKGRVASLLEVGTGFHPELTGRENIFLNGAILGMSRAEIKKHFDEIVDFAEIEKFLDTPVKRYSSGMYVRLAFAVAAHLEPEILVVDEVLAVGDAQFQKKCLGKMEDVSKNGGRTVLFVSHNISAMQSLCNLGILLEKGSLICYNNIAKTAATYLKQAALGNPKVSWSFDKAPGNSLAKFLFAEIRGINNEDNANVIEVGDAVQLEIVFFNLKKGTTALDVTFHLIDELGHLVFVGSSSIHQPELKYFDTGEVRFICHIPMNLLHEGNYNIGRLLLVQDRGILNYEVRDVLQFEITAKRDEDFGWMGGKEGIVKPKLEWIYKSIT